MNEITEPRARHIVLDQEDAAHLAGFFGEMADGLRAQDADTLADVLEGIAERLDLYLDNGWYSDDDLPLEHLELTWCMTLTPTRYELEVTIDPVVSVSA